MFFWSYILTHSFWSSDCQGVCSNKANTSSDPPVLHWSACCIIFERSREAYGSLFKTQPFVAGRSDGMEVRLLIHRVLNTSKFSSKLSLLVGSVPRPIAICVSNLLFISISDGAHWCLVTVNCSCYISRIEVTLDGEVFATIFPCEINSYIASKFGLFT